MGAVALVLSLFMVAPPFAADATPSLTTLAAATNRPAECAALVPRSGSRKPSIWRLARMPTLGAYCDDIARAHALMASDPKSALKAAEAADAALPDRASPSVAIGRARLATGDVKGALDAFGRALALDKRSLDEPKAMDDYARALVVSGKATDAAVHYRALVPRAELLPDSARPLVYLQAAHALMAHAASSATTAKPHDGPHSDAAVASDLADAAAYLGEARSGESTSMRGDVLLSLALLFDRSAEPEKASAALAEATRAGAAVTDQGKAYVASPADSLALAALAAEAKAPSSAIEAWNKFLDTSPPPAWAVAAKARVAQLKHGGGKATQAEPRKPESKRGAK